MLFDEIEADDEFETLADEAAPVGLVAPREMEHCTGQDELEAALLALAQSERMPHALIFAGGEGVGKATMAFRLARFLLAQKESEDAGGGLFGEVLPAVKVPENFYLAPDDPLFRQIAAGGHPDLMTVEREVDERTGKRKSGVAVDTVRKVAPFLRMTAAQGGWRIVIVDDADTMNRSAQNALLKVLEEPPARTVLILVTHRIGALIPTIRSRCRVINVPALARDDFATLLRKEHPGLTTDDIDALYSITAGSGGQALKLWEEGGLTALDKMLEAFESWPRWHWPALHKLADSLARAGQDQAYDGFCTIMLWSCHMLLRSKARGEALPERLKALAPLQDHYSLEGWIKICETLKDHFESFERANLDKRQAVLGAFMIYEEQE